MNPNNSYLTQALTRTVSLAQLYPFKTILNYQLSMVKFLIEAEQFNWTYQLEVKVSNFNIHLFVE